MPQRIQVSSAASADPVHLTFNINPSFYDPADEVKVNSVPVLHGAPIYQQKSFDDSQRIMRWSGIPVSDSHLSTVVGYFRSIEGEIRYFNFNDMAVMNTRWPDVAVSSDTATWKKARIITIRPKYRPGGAFRYDTVELVLQPEV